MTRIHALLALIFFLAACGQSGPLYLPGDPSEIQDAPQPAETENEDEEEESGASG